MDDRRKRIMINRLGPLAVEVLPQIGEPVAGALVTAGIKSENLSQRARLPNFLVCQGPTVRSAGPKVAELLDLGGGWAVKRRTQTSL